MITTLPLLQEDWNIMVFQRASYGTMSELQKSYLEMSGGQTVFQCRYHQCFLVKAICRINEKAQ